MIGNLDQCAKERKDRRKFKAMAMIAKAFQRLSFADRQWVISRLESDHKKMTKESK